MLCLVTLCALVLSPKAHWIENGISVCTADDNQWAPQIILSDSGQTIIVWDDNRSGEFDIYAQRIDIPYGDIMWGIDGTRVCSTSISFAQTQCQITSDGAGGAIIVWNESRPGAPHPVGAQRIDADGNTLWGECGVEVGEGQSSNSLPQLISDGAGGAIITWIKYVMGGLDIHSQRIDADGQRLWGQDGVVICDTTGNQGEPQIISDGAGGAIIVWADARGGNWDIYAQRIDADCNTLWTPCGVAICDTVGDQRLPQLVSDGAGGAIVVWEDSREANRDIYAQRVDANGVTLWTSCGEVVSGATGDQRFPRILSDDDAGAIIIWHQG